MSIGAISHSPPPPCHGQWHLKLTFFKDQVPGKNADEKVPRIEALCLLVDFGRIVGLLRDAVTELTFSPKDHWDGSLASQTLPLQESAFDATAAEFVRGSRIYTRKDPRRVFYPKYEGSATRYRLSQIVTVKPLERAVDLVKVKLGGDERDRLYVYKRIDRPYYDPVDSKCIEQEVKNLELPPASDFVVRLVSVVLSPNPYRTDQGQDGNRHDRQEPSLDSPDNKVLRGFLVDYYPNGTLEEVLARPPDPTRQYPWRLWALQFAQGLRHLHDHGITHADLKPCNLVLDVQDKLVIIDICGIGTTYIWLSPDMIEAINGGRHTCDVAPATRVQNDIWAFGKIVLEMSRRCTCKDGKALLECVGEQATTLKAPRIPLANAISLLSEGRRV